MISYMMCPCFTKFPTLSLDQFFGVQVWFESPPGHQIKTYPSTYGLFVNGLLSCVISRE